MGKGTVPVKLGSSAVRQSVLPRALEQGLPATDLPFSAAEGKLYNPFAVRSLSPGKIVITWFTREG